MARSPDIAGMDVPPGVGTVVGAAVGAGGDAADLREAVLVIDARQNALPILLCNASAGRYFAGATLPAPRLYGSSLQNLLGTGAPQALKSALSALSGSAPCARRVLAWRRAPGEVLLPTELRLLESAPGERQVMLSFAPARAAPAGSAPQEIAERERWERDLLEAANRERLRLGCDLHDGVGQELTGVALMLGVLAKDIQRHHPAAAGSVEEIAGLLRHTIDNVRSLTRGMLPVSAHAGGLEGALRELAVRSSALYAMKVFVCAEVRPSITVSDSHASHLYRIAQEALANAARHGGATLVDMLLVITHGTLLLRIADDGRGMAAAAQAGTGSDTGMGLRIMEYRAAILGARLEISDNAPKGTVVRVISEAPEVTIRL